MTVRPRVFRRMFQLLRQTVEMLDNFGPSTRTIPVTSQPPHSFSPSPLHATPPPPSSLFHLLPVTGEARRYPSTSPGEAHHHRDASPACPRSSPASPLLPSTIAGALRHCRLRGAERGRPDLQLRHQLEQRASRQQRASRPAYAPACLRDDVHHPESQVCTTCLARCLQWISERFSRLEWARRVCLPSPFSGMTASASLIASALCASLAPPRPADPPPPPSHLQQTRPLDTVGTSAAN